MPSPVQSPPMPSPVQSPPIQPPAIQPLAPLGIASHPSSLSSGTAQPAQGPGYIETAFIWIKNVIVKFFQWIFGTKPAVVPPSMAEALPPQPPPPMAGALPPPPSSQDLKEQVVEVTGMDLLPKLDTCNKSIRSHILVTIGGEVWLESSRSFKSWTWSYQELGYDAVIQNPNLLLPYASNLLPKVSTQ